MTPLVIRAATVKDVSSIVRVRLATLNAKEIRGFSAPEFATTSSTEKLQKLWGKGNRLKDGFDVFVAEGDGKVIGYMTFKTGGDSGYIDDIVVAKEEKGTGIGRALVAYAEGVAKSKGCHLMKTDTTENANGVPWKAYGFWVRLGYEDTGKRLPTDYDFKKIPLIKRLK